jgi:hypothetical protein
MKKPNDQFLAEIFTTPPGEAGPHPDNDALAAYAENTLTGETKNGLDYHLERCPECAEIVDRLIDAETGLKSLPFPVYLPEFDAVHARRQGFEASFGEPLALAASAQELLPEIVPVYDLLPGFQGEATGDGCAPSEASMLRLVFAASESPRPRELPPGGIIVVWPTGQTGPHGFIHRSGAWRADIRLPLPWPETVAMLRGRNIRIEPVPPT